jgi:hypothetical protein
MAESSITRGIAVDPRVKNAKAVEMHVNAGLFLRDAVSLRENATAGQFILFMHAIELALKSFLHLKGQSLKTLQLNFRHDLDALLAEARKAGLEVAEADADAVVSRLNKYTERAAIRYDFSFTMPLVADVRRVTQSILKATEPVLPPVGTPP